MHFQAGIWQFTNDTVCRHVHSLCRGGDSSSKSIVDQVQVLWIGEVEVDVSRLQVALDESTLVHMFES